MFWLSFLGGAIIGVCFTICGIAMYLLPKTDDKREAEVLASQTVHNI